MPYYTFTFQITRPLYNFSGWGKFTSHETSSFYEGNWKDGLKDGSGTIVLASGDSFTGEWRRGLINGPVVYSFHEKSPWNDPEY